jgi:UDP-2,4-diacetamido-2,4,6-trideoxy-beta-L-altropyranose hydrolase
LIIAIRADAGTVQGTGHVMRCLSLAEKLVQIGHRVGLFTNSSEIGWLEVAIKTSGVEVFRVPSDEIANELFEPFNPDWVIVDSYQIPAEKISELNEQIRVLAIIDGNTRAISATGYLDTNLFAEKLDWPKSVRSNLLAGSKFALVRDAVLKNKRSHPELITNSPAKTFGVFRWL